MKLEKCLLASNTPPSHPPSPIPPQLSQKELHRIEVKRELRIRLDIQQKMKELQNNSSKKKKKKEFSHPSFNCFADLRHCIFDNEFRREFEFKPAYSNQFEFTKDDDKYDSLNFIREHFYPNIPAFLVYESEYNYYYEEAFRERMRDDKWVEKVIQKDINNHCSSHLRKQFTRRSNEINETKALAYTTPKNPTMTSEMTFNPQSTLPPLIPSQVLHHDNLKK